MTAVIADPQTLTEVGANPAEIAASDPYGLGFPADCVNKTGNSTVTEYDLRPGLRGYFSYSTRFGYALVIRANGDTEVFAGLVSGRDEARSIASRYVS